MSAALDLSPLGGLLPAAGPGSMRGVRVPGVRGRAARAEAAEEREAGFRSFYEREWSALARYCHRLLGDREHAQDVAQEAFTRMVGRLGSVDDPRAYLYGVATNLCRRAWRKRAQDALAVDRIAALPRTDVDAPESAVAVRAAVDALPPRLRDVVLLHYYADLTVAGVAAATDRPEGTIKRQLSEARAALGGLLEADRG